MRPGRAVPGCCLETENTRYALLEFRIFRLFSHKLRFTSRANLSGARLAVLRTHGEFISDFWWFLKNHGVQKFLCGMKTLVREFAPTVFEGHRAWMFVLG